MSFLSRGGLRRMSDYKKEEEARRRRRGKKKEEEKEKEKAESGKGGAIVVKRSKDVAAARRKREREARKKTKLDTQVEKQRKEIEDRGTGSRQTKTRKTRREGNKKREEEKRGIWGKKPANVQKEKRKVVKRSSWREEPKERGGGKTYLIGRPRASRPASSATTGAPTKKNARTRNAEIRSIDFVRPTVPTRTQKRKHASSSSTSITGSLTIEEKARDPWSLMRVVRRGRGGAFAATKEYAESRRASLPPIPSLYGNVKAVNEVTDYMMPCSPKAPLRLLITGPSGCGKTWLLNLIVQRWQHMTSVRHTINNENFEELAENKGMPFPKDTQLLIAVDVDELSPKAVAKLRGLMQNEGCKSQFLLTARNIYEDKELYFLRKTPKKRLYPCTNRKALMEFVRTLRLKPPIPQHDVFSLCFQCEGDLRQLEIMARTCSRSLKGRGGRGLVCSGEKTQDMWTESRTFLKGKNEEPVSEIASLMAYSSLLDNVERIEDVAEVADRFSFADTVGHRWSKSEHLKNMHGITLTGDAVTWPRDMIELQKKTTVSSNFFRRVRLFFNIWGYQSQASGMVAQLQDFGNFWTAYRSALPDAELQRILRQAGEDLNFIADLMQVLFPAYRTGEF